MKKSKKKHRITLIEILAILILINIIGLYFISKALIIKEKNRPHLTVIKINNIISKKTNPLTCESYHTAWKIKKTCNTYIETDSNPIRIKVLDFNKEEDAYNYFDKNTTGKIIEEGIGKKLTIKEVKDSQKIIKTIYNNKIVIEISGTTDYEKEIDQIIEDIIKIVGET